MRPPTCTRRELLRAAGLGAGVLAAGRIARGAAAAEGPGRPNVIVLITDDQGYGDLACHGNRVIRTPNLDRLHARSVRLAVGRAEQAKPIPRGAAAVTFTVGLKAGETRVQTWLTDEQSGESRGAYYVYVRPAG